MSLFWRIALTCLGLFLIAAVLFPVFNQPIGISPRAICQSNYAQLGLALTQYTQDSDNTLPPTVSSTGQGWREATYPYVKSVNIYRCPDDQRTEAKYSQTNLPKSYGANSLGPGLKGIDRGAFAGPTEKPTTLEGFPSLTDTITVTDMRGGDTADWNMVSPAFLPSTGRRLYAHFPKHWFLERPPGSVIVLFMDGHVKALAPEATLAPTNLWARDNKPFTGQDLQNAQAILTRAAQEQ